MTNTFLQNKIIHDHQTKRLRHLLLGVLEGVCLILFIVGILLQDGFFIAFGLLHGLIYLIHFPQHVTAMSDLAYFGFVPYQKRWPFYRQIFILAAIEICILLMCLPFLKIGSIVFSIIGLSTALFLILLIVFQRRYLQDLMRIIYRNR